MDYTALLIRTKNAYRSTVGTWADPSRDGKYVPKVKRSDVSDLDRYWSREADRAIGDAIRKEMTAASLFFFDVYTATSTAGDWSRYLAARDRALAAGSVSVGQIVPFVETEEFWYQLGKLALRLAATSYAPSASERGWEAFSEAVQEAPGVIKEAVKDVVTAAAETAGAAAGALSKGLVSGLVAGLGIPLALIAAGVAIYYWKK